MPPAPLPAWSSLIAGWICGLSRDSGGLCHAAICVLSSSITAGEAGMRASFRALLLFAVRLREAKAGRAVAWFLVPHLVITGSGYSKTSLDLMFLSKCQGSQKEALFIHFSFLPPSLPPTPPSSFLTFLLFTYSVNKYLLTACLCKTLCSSLRKIQIHIRQWP